MEGLTQYLKEVAMLECQLNTENRLITQINQCADRLARPQYLEKPVLTPVSYELSNFGNFWLGISLLCGLAMFYYILGMLPRGSLRNFPALIAFAIIMLPPVLIGILVYLSYRIPSRIMTKRAHEKYFQRRLEDYHVRKEQDKQRIQQENIVKRNYLSQISQVQQERGRTQSSLNQLYSLDIIHPKYRNFVAISSFYDYFDTGRCVTLTGPGGAYATYEEDLRFRRIENRMDVIISKLDEIIDNQQYLGELMREANSTLNHIAKTNDQIMKSMGRVVENSELTAYNTQCSARSEAVMEHISVYYALKNF